MAKITFSPSASSIDPVLLTAKSTAAKVCFNPKEIYVDATVSPIGRGGRWEVNVESIPRQDNVSGADTNAVLCLTKGELGPVVGRVDLGRIQA